MQTNELKVLPGHYMNIYIYILNAVINVAFKPHMLEEKNCEVLSAHAFTI